MEKKSEIFKSVEEILEKNIREGNISLILDAYDDIFSDFDPRPYGERALSDDFLSECNKAARDMGEKFELRLMVPAKLRNLKEELKIRKRLKSHFQRHAEEKRKELFNIRKEGVIWFLIGTLVMLASAFFYGQTTFIFHLLEVMLVPAGWFLFWDGLEKVFIESKEKLPDYTFYKKMSGCQVYFISY